MEIIKNPNIEIFVPYIGKGYEIYYAKILKTHYEQGKHIPFYIENSIAPSIFNIEKQLLTNNNIILRFSIEDKNTYVKYKLKYM